MKFILLDGEKMNTKEEVHEYISKILNVPGHYGKNLDALWDVLSTYDEPIRILFKNTQTLKINLGEYGNKILKIFLEAKEDNDNIFIEIENLL